MHYMPTVDAFIPTRQTLLSRLKDRSDDESWKEFFELYWKLIYNAAVKAGLSDAEARDVVQETILALTRSLPDFKYDPAVGTFKGYLLKLTSWRISDQFRRRIPQGENFKGPETETSPLCQVADPNGFVPEIFWDEEWQRNLVEVARERVKQKVNPKHYQIFDLHVDQGWSVKKVADRLGVNSALVHLVRHRITRLLRKEIEELKPKEKKHS